MVAVRSNPKTSTNSSRARRSAGGCWRSFHSKPRDRSPTGGGNPATAPIKVVMGVIGTNSAASRRRWWASSSCTRSIVIGYELCQALAPVADAILSGRHALIGSWPPTTEASGPALGPAPPPRTMTTPATTATKAAVDSPITRRLTTRSPRWLPEQAAVYLITQLEPAFDRVRKFYFQTQKMRYPSDIETRPPTRAT